MWFDVGAVHKWWSGSFQQVDFSRWLGTFLVNSWCTSIASAHSLRDSRVGRPAPRRSSEWLARANSGNPSGELLGTEISPADLPHFLLHCLRQLTHILRSDVCNIHNISCAVQLSRGNI